MTKRKSRRPGAGDARPVDGSRPIAAAQAYVDACLPVLRLWGWRVRVLPEGIDDGFAAIHVTRAQHTAELRLGPAFWAGDSTDRRETIAHELLHCWTEPVFHQTIACAKPYLSVPGAETLGTLLEDAYDVIADELSRVVAPLLPEWTD